MPRLRSDTGSTATAVIALAIAAVIAVVAWVSPSVGDGILPLLAPLLAAAVLARRAAATRGRARLVWHLLTLHALLVGGGNAATLIQRTVTESGGAGIADGLYLAAVAPLVLAVVRAATERSDTRLSDLLIDATAVAVVAGLGIWQVVVLDGHSLSTGSALDRIVGGAYPVANVLIVGALAAFVFARAHMSRAVALVGGYAGLTLALGLLDLMHGVAALPSWVATLIASGSVVAFGVLAAAALVTDVDETQLPVRETGSVPRLTLLGIAVCCAPAMAVILSPATAARGFRSSSRRPWR